MSTALSRAVEVDGPPRASSGSVAPQEPLWLGTSWKMTKTLAESRAYVDGLAQAELPTGVEVFVLPPLTALHTVLESLPTGSPVLVGVQNAHWAPDGPVTGEVSMRLVRDAGAQVVEIGHSDRRTQFGETDQVVAAKVTAALDQHLVPLVCVGEPWSVRAAGRAAEHVADQLRTALSGVAAADLSKVLVAYEPVWAIGAPEPADPAFIRGVCSRLRTEVAARGDGSVVIYGGSAGPGLLAQVRDDVDGLFLGRFAHDPAALRAVIDEAAAA